MKKQNPELDDRLANAPTDLLPSVQLIVRRRGRREPVGTAEETAIREPRRRNREQEKYARRAPGRATYDLTPELKARIQAMAAEPNRRIPASQLVMLALVRFLQEYEAGAIDLRPLLEITTSPKFDFVLDVPRILAPLAAPAAGKNSPSLARKARGDQGT